MNGSRKLIVWQEIIQKIDLNQAKGFHSRHDTVPIAVISGINTIAVQYVRLVDVISNHELLIVQIP